MGGLIGRVTKNKDGLLPKYRYNIEGADLPRHILKITGYACATLIVQTSHGYYKNISSIVYVQYGAGMSQIQAYALTKGYSSSSLAFSIKYKINNDESMDVYMKGSVLACSVLSASNSGKLQLIDQVIDIPSDCQEAEYINFT